MSIAAFGHKLASDKSCSANSDCYFLLDSRCISGFCTCDAGLVEEISSEGDKCVPVAVYIREPCKTDPKCSGLGPNSHCILDGNGQGHCECDANNHFLLGKCWRSIALHITQLCLGNLLFCGKLVTNATSIGSRELRDDTIMIQTTIDTQPSNIMAISEIPLSNTTNIQVKVEPHRFLNICKGVVTCYDFDCRDITSQAVPNIMAPKLVQETDPPKRSSPPPIPTRSHPRGIGEECTSDDECYTKHNPHRVTCQNSRCGCFPIEQYRPNDDNTACVDSGSYSHIHQALLTVSIFLTMYAAF
uniref:(California timema) hypothetical protein n=1 Tax=Timema californicum TaxID=61474 RepID=A0A7R9P9Q7_TIMCA|nr:unnamed protein product [Timema californicum]